MQDRQSDHLLSSIDSSARGRVDEVISRWGRGVSSTRWWIRFGLSLLLVAVISLLDLASGSEMSVSTFYLIPVSFAAGFVSRRVGWVVSVLCAGAWGYLDVTTGPGYSEAWIPYWNSAARLGVFLLVTMLIDGLRIAHARERTLSRTDSLTGIANEREFREHAERVIAQSRRSGRPFALTYADLDHFKEVNDKFGHFEGDRLLCAVAQVITDSLRTTDVVARLGGDEFGILMPETDGEHARVTIARIAAALNGELESRWR